MATTTSNGHDRSSTTTMSRIFPQAPHFLSRDKDHHIHTVLDASRAPAIRVNPNDLVEVQTFDCFHGLVTPEHPERIDRIPHDQLNPVTGPIFVQGAMPGDVVSIELLDIQPCGIGVACCNCHCGQLSHWISNDRTTVKFFDLSDDGKMVTMRRDNKNNPSISFPAAPMLGVVGVAPAAEPISTMPAGRHGGNLDNPYNTVGSMLHISVQVPGALISLGDMHAAQGDGEISGTGVEIGGSVLLRCTLVPQRQLVPEQQLSSSSLSLPNYLPDLFPITETATHWMTYGIAVEDLPQTTKLACEQAAVLLVQQWGFTMEEAFIFLSVQGDLGWCQACHPDKGTQIARMKMPKIAACPRPFRVLLLEQQEK